MWTPLTIGSVVRLTTIRGRPSTGAGCTVVVCDAALSAGVGFSSVAVTEALLAIVPGAGGADRASVTVAPAPGAIVQSEHAIVDVPEHEPCVGRAETSVAPAGSSSVSDVAVADEGPALATVST